MNFVSKAENTSAFLIVTSLVLSLTATPVAQANEIEQGKAVAQMCIGCHGENGQSLNPEWPNLAGQQKNYLMKQLKDFKSDARKHEIMGPMAKTLSDKDIELVATYFNSLK